MKKINTGISDADYKVRILSCIVAVEVLALAVFNLWPAPEGDDYSNRDVSFSEQQYSFEEIEITMQESNPPPPPKPRVSLPVPTDKIIEEEIPELEDFDISEFSDPISEGTIGEQGDTGRVVSNPQTNPSVTRIVEPTTPDEAKKANIRAEVWVTFLVDRNGTVEEANISEIRLYGKNGNYETLQSIGYGITEATLRAALQWKFRPARDNGEPVKAYVRHIFSYGF